MAKLTKRMIDAVTPPASGQIFLRDDALEGFALRVTANGSKSFIVEKRIYGRPRRWTVGRYGPLTLDQARDLAVKEMAKIAGGEDPVTERQQRRHAPTWKDLEQLFLERHASRKKSKINDVGILNNHLAHWRPRRLTSITREEIVTLHTKIGTQPSTVVRPEAPIAKPAPRLANSILALIRSMFNRAIDWGLYQGPNPVVRIKKFEETKRDRFVKPDELPRLFQAMQTEPNVYVRAALFVGLLTGARGMKC